MTVPDNLGPKVDVGGILFSDVDFDTTMNAIEAFIKSGKPRHITTANADFVVKASRDKRFREEVNRSDMVVADGMSMIYASRYLGTPLKERVTGLDIAERICLLSAGKGYKLFFLGATEKVSETALKRMKKFYPGINICGAYSPPFGEFSKDEEDRIHSRITSAAPDVVLVCFSSDKHMRWINNNKERLTVPVCICVGCFMDLMAGRIRRAPKRVRDAGLEWLFRLFQDPVRLFKRYLIDDTAILGILWRQKNGKNKAEHEKEG
jgi:N-acetylglucosaminyldiphosphoundecaprenol N-acetyl-beta-D-mannosaminyltransferase